MTDIDFTALASSDADFVARLIDNNEMNRALVHARLLVSSIEGAMRQQGIKQTHVIVHDSTPRN